MDEGGEALARRLPELDVNLASLQLTNPEEFFVELLDGRRIAEEMNGPLVAVDGEAPRYIT